MRRGAALLLAKGVQADDFARRGGRFFLVRFGGGRGLLALGRLGEGCRRRCRERFKFAVFVHFAELQTEGDARIGKLRQRGEGDESVAGTFLNESVTSK